MGREGPLRSEPRAPPHPLVLAPGLAGGAILGAPAPRHGMRPPHHHLSPYLCSLPVQRGRAGSGAYDPSPVLN